MKIIIAIIVIALIVIGGYFLLKGNNPPAVSEQLNSTAQSSTPAQSNAVTSPESSTAQVETKDEVVYTDSGYAPQTLTIKVGNTVIFKNESSGGMWTASAMHPSHTVYSNTSLGQHCPDTANTSFDECTSAQPGQSWSFTFQKQGTWGYHNHVNAHHFGKIIVE